MTDLTVVIDTPAPLNVAVAAPAPINAEISAGDGTPATIEAPAPLSVSVVTPAPLIAQIIPNQPGPQGEQGEAGTTAAVTDQFIAGEILSALRVVCAIDEEVFYADKDEAAEVFTVVGVTITAGLTNEVVNVVSQGVIEDVAWDWDTDQHFVFLGVNGALTQAPPASGWMLKIGSVIAVDKIFVEIGEPVNRG